MTREFYTATQVARLCGLCHRTIRSMAATGRLRAKTHPGSSHLRVSHRDLIDFLVNERLWGPLLELRFPMQLLIAGVSRELGCDLVALAKGGSVWSQCWIDAGLDYARHQMPAAVIDLEDYEGAIECARGYRAGSPGRFLIGILPEFELLEKNRALFDRLYPQPVDAKALLADVPFYPLLEAPDAD